MATITIEIPNAHATRLRAALARELSVPVGDIGLPEAKAYIIQQLKDVVRWNEQQELLETFSSTDITPT